MSASHTCPKCNSLLPADAPEGLCPACLMLGGFATEAATVKLTPSHPSSSSNPQVTLPVEHLKPLFPNLEIIELLGRGGMGTVYKARQTKLNRFVALKIISAEAGADPHFAERFQREAQALAKLNHPNIVSVFDFGETGGLFYFLMEFVDGANLRTLIQSGEMKPEAALALIPSFCDALQYAHDEGVVHRDIKPENVLVDKKGRVKIADFGLAKLLGHETADHTLTRTGMYLGTPRYMAPEQVDKPDTVDHRADIYSLGVVFYEMLTGEIPMGRFDPPSKKVQVDVKLDDIVLHALERDVDRRYQHASEIKTDVQSVTGKPRGNGHQPKQEGARAWQAPAAASAAAESGTGQPLPRQFWLRAFGLLMLGWLVVGTLWNYRTAGCVLGALVLSGIATEVAFRHARSKPRWQREWRAAAAWKRVYLVSGYIAVGVVPFMLLISTLDTVWEGGKLRWNWDAQSADDFAAAYKGKEYQLIRGLDAFKEDVPVTELAQTGFSWRSGWNLWGDTGPHHGLFGATSIIAGAVAVLLILLVFYQQIVGQESFSLVRIATGGWRPALKFVLTVLVSSVCAYATIFMFYLYTQAMGNSDYMSRSRMVAASVKQVEMALKKWAMENDQATGDEARWNLSTVPKGVAVAEAALFSAWTPSPFDRWQMTWSGLRRMSPHVAARIVGTEKPLQAFVLFSAKMPMRDAQDKAQMERVLQSMEAAINSAAKLDAKTPLDQQTTARPSAHAAANDISGWWLVAGVIGFSIAWTMMRHGRENTGATPEPSRDQTACKNGFRRESWWFSRSPAVQKLMSIVLGAVLVLSLLCFFSFRIVATTTADHSGVVRNLYDATVGLGDPWLFLIHHKVGTRDGMESGMNWFTGSALFGVAAWFAGAALTRLTREQKRRKALPDASTDIPQRKFFWSAIVGVVLFVAGIIGVIVHQARIDLGPRWADAKQVHPDFTRPGSLSLALKKAIADELKLTPEQLEKVNAALNRAQLDFLKLENDHSIFRSVRGHLVKEVKPFPDRSLELAQRLAKELRDLTGQDIIETPVRGEVWKLRLFGHAGECNVRAEIWQENGKFHVEDVWECEGEKITSKFGEGFEELRAISGGAYVLDWEAEKDILHEPRPDDETTGFTKGWDTMQVFIGLVRQDELSQMLALDPKTVRTAANPRAALITQAGTDLGRSLIETQLKLHGIPFTKDATPEQLVKKLEQLLGAPPAP